MPRPERIEYDYACYHVMNRGRDHQAIFHDKRYYEAFLLSLQESYQRFNAVIHTYCLMGNHYHLLIETPDANLGRIMRHINGTYTQRYNRLKKADGPLFRGRYKAILIEADAYLLQVNRYIHRNPIETKVPIVEKLEDYPWSSYPAYIRQVKAPEWLYCDDSYRMISQKQKIPAFKRFVEKGNEAEFLNNYQKGNYPAVIGEQGFRQWVYEDILPEYKKTKKARIISHRHEMLNIVKIVATVFKESEGRILETAKGRHVKRCDARRVAMYVCQEVADYQLKEIAKYFGLTNSGSVSFAISTLRKELEERGKLKKKVDQVIKELI